MITSRGAAFTAPATQATKTSRSPSMFFLHPDISLEIELSGRARMLWHWWVHTFWGGEFFISTNICHLSSDQQPNMQIFFLMKSSKSFSTASPMQTTYQINYCGPNTNCNNLPGTSVYYGLNMLSAALLFFILLLVPFESLYSFDLFLLL